MRSFSLSKFSTFSIFYFMGIFYFSILVLISSLLDRQTRQMIIFVKLWGMQPSPKLLMISEKTLLDFSERAQRLNMSQSISSRLTSTESQRRFKFSMEMGMPQPLNIQKTSSLESPPEPSKSKSLKICSMDISFTNYWGKQRQLLFLRFQFRQRVRSHLMKEALESLERIASVFFFFYYIYEVLLQRAIWQKQGRKDENGLLLD